MLVMHKHNTKVLFFRVFSKLSSDETRQTKQKFEVFNKVFCVSPLVSLVIFNKRNARKTYKCFWCQGSTQRVMIPHSRQGFEISRRNSLLS